MSFCPSSSSAKDALLQSGPAEFSPSAGLPVVDASLVDESQRVQQAVHKIQLQTSAIQREANRLVGSTDVMSVPDKQAVQEAFRLGQESTEECRRLLDNWGAASSSAGQKATDIRRLKREKLMQNLSSAASGLDAAWKKYTAAYEEKKAAAAARAAKGAALEEQGGEVLPQAVQQSRLQVQDDVMQTEVETHAEMAAEYAEDVASLASDIRSLQSCMVDLARLTQEQGNSLDDIEANTRQGADASQGATEQLQIASKLQQKHLKFICGLLTTATMFATFAVFVVAHR